MKKAGVTMGKIEVVDMYALPTTSKCECGEKIEFCIEALEQEHWIFMCKDCLTDVSKQIIDVLSNRRV
jgi:hypothetical protein